ncbi:hypothetical protein ABTX60_28580 [Streptomyces sp. NPDC126510]|uniref:hypothetical protein n=1 Tax=Streptomyces sp. NPDC126510 TaxID=3155317 RepID=UPI0033175A3C
MTLTIGALRAEPGRTAGSGRGRRPTGDQPGGAVGYERVIFGTSPDGGNSHAAANPCGIPAILAETGRLGDRDPATIRRLLDGLYRLLHHL